jgi:hypothetical protein
MNINRNNYEQFFLLYADNELSAVEKSLVTKFVQQNPDLEEEFLMLQQSVVTPDKDVTLGDKSFLLRQENQFIGKHNYEEIFIAYNDGELSKDKKQEVEKFLTDHPGMQKQFSLFQQLKFEPDHSIVFPGKRSLLKKEHKVRVIPLNVRRALVAAVILGAGLWTGVNYLMEEKTPVTVVKVTPPPQVNSKLDKSSEAEQSASNANNNTVANSTVNNSPAAKITVRDTRSQGTLHPVQEVVKNAEPQKHKHLIIPDNIEKPKNEITIKQPVKINDVAIQLPETPDKITTEELKPDIQVTNEKEAENYAQTASYRLEAKNDNYVFYNVTEEQFKKTRLFGFLKKVKRVIERKSPFNHNNDKAELAVN